MGGFTALLSYKKRKSSCLLSKLANVFTSEMTCYPGMKYSRKPQQIWGRKMKQDVRMLINVEVGDRHIEVHYLILYIFA